MGGWDPCHTSSNIFPTALVNYSFSLHAPFNEHIEIALLEASVLVKANEFD